MSTLGEKSTTRGWGWGWGEEEEEEEEEVRR